jgi:isopentenyl diphosphate isomerase/L-lactate dehydrogenase-like FMN-dependent dehydrogenase
MEKDLRTNMVLTGAKSVREIDQHLLAMQSLPELAGAEWGSIAGRG